MVDRKLIRNLVFILLTLAMGFFALIFLIDTAMNHKIGFALEQLSVIRQSQASRWAQIPG